MPHDTLEDLRRGAAAASGNTLEVEKVQRGKVHSPPDLVASDDHRVEETVTEEMTREEVVRERPPLPEGSVEWTHDDSDAGQLELPRLGSGRRLRTRMLGVLAPVAVVLSLVQLVAVDSAAISSALALSPWILLGVLWWRWQQLVDGPLKTFRSDLNVVREGRLGHSLKQDRPDEVGDLSLVVDALVKELKRTRDEVRAQQQQLQRKVWERTQELHKTAVSLREQKEERERVLAELQTAQRKLLSQDRMANMGRVLAGIAHELNNPVNFVANSVQPLQTSLERLSEALARYRALHRMPPSLYSTRLEELLLVYREDHLNKVVQRLERGLRNISFGSAQTAQIVSRMRFFGRGADAGLCLYDLREALEANLLLLNRDLRDRVEVHREFEEAVPAIECNSAEINQIMINLISNAAQAIKGKGAIWLSLWQAEDGRVAFRVGDNGSGIPEKLIQDIWKPFMTTKGIEGTGLGLAITAEVVTRHHGEIEVRSQAGVGTEFTVYLPVKQPEGPLVEPSSTPLAVDAPGMTLASPIPDQTGEDDHDDTFISPPLPSDDDAYRTLTGLPAPTGSGEILYSPDDTAPTGVPTLRAEDPGQSLDEENSSTVHDSLAGAAQRSPEQLERERQRAARRRAKREAREARRRGQADPEAQ